MKGFMYILQCSNGQYYTGSTNNLELRLAQHQNGEGANFTKKHLPVQLVYYEEFSRIDLAFYREKQVQGWSRKKKEALINGQFAKLHDFSKCKNETHFRSDLKRVASTSLSHREDRTLSHQVEVGSLSEAETTSLRANSPDDLKSPDE
jgi:putative endonuclease